MSDQITEKPDFQPGDKVSFVIRKKAKRGYKFDARIGWLVEINGDMAAVKVRNGRIRHVYTSTLRPAGQHNALTEAVLGAARGQ